MNGDVSKLDYFVTREDLPEYTKYVDSKLGTVVEYKEPNGQISKRRLIFPENTENHYRKVPIMVRIIIFIILFTHSNLI